MLLAKIRLIAVSGVFLCVSSLYGLAARATTPEEAAAAAEASSNLSAAAYKALQDADAAAAKAFEAGRSTEESRAKIMVADEVITKKFNGNGMAAASLQKTFAEEQKQTKKAKDQVNEQLPKLEEAREKAAKALKEQEANCFDICDRETLEKIKAHKSALDKIEEQHAHAAELSEALDQEERDLEKASDDLKKGIVKRGGKDTGGDGDDGDPAAGKAKADPETGGPTQQAKNDGAGGGEKTPEKKQEGQQGQNPLGGLGDLAKMMNQQKPPPPQPTQIPPNQITQNPACITNPRGHGCGEGASQTAAYSAMKNGEQKTDKSTDPGLPNLPKSGPQAADDSADSNGRPNSPPPPPSPGGRSGVTADVKGQPKNDSGGGYAAPPPPSTGPLAGFYGGGAQGGFGSGSRAEAPRLRAPSRLALNRARLTRKLHDSTMERFRRGPSTMFAQQGALDNGPSRPNWNKVRVRYSSLRSTLLP